MTAWKCPNCGFHCTDDEYKQLDLDKSVHVTGADQGAGLCGGTLIPTDAARRIVRESGK